YGAIGMEALKAITELGEQGISAGHYNMRFVKPLDTALIDEIMSNYKHIITIEDGVVHGGFGSAVAEYVVARTHPIPVTIMGVPDRIIEHGSQEELRAEAGIDAKAIVQKVKAMLPAIA
ncbi:MAG TPA: transketolase C-terminal domain-containing protein, partial [Balneolales bacterium]|nr:transketolase C-terminal domain-containing protein [Balneolales bacterium]